MNKKIFIAAAVMLAAMATQVSAEYNKYNEMDAVNIYNNTLQDVADMSETTVEEFKKQFGLPEDMPADTNETIALDHVSLKAWAENSGITFEEALPELQALYKGEEELTEDTRYGDLLNNVTFADYLGEADVDAVIAELNIDGMTAESLYGDIRTKVERKLLEAAGTLSYVKDDAILVMLNGKYIDFDVAPIIMNDRVMVPMRNIFEALGATVNWMGETKTIFAGKGTDVITMQVGQSSFFKNEEKIEIDAPSVIVDERALVPIRAVAEALDTQVYYNENTKTVVIH